MADNSTITEVIYEFLDKPGVSNLSKALLTKVNMRIQERIIDTIDENSDDHHVPSAGAVYKAINQMSHIKFKPYTGLIEDIVDPDPKYIYLQRDSESDNEWTLYIYDVEEFGWIEIGRTDFDISNYWSKSQDDIDALKLALGLDERFANINNNITDIQNDIIEIKNDIEELNIAMESKVDESQLVKLTDEEIEAAVNEAFNSTDPDL